MVYLKINIDVTVVYYIVYPSILWYTILYIYVRIRLFKKSIERKNYVYSSGLEWHEERYKIHRNILVNCFARTSFK